MNEARGYGFRITKRSDPFLGHLWPSDGYGLQDPSTGSLIAVSPDDGFFVTLLVNGRNHAAGPPGCGAYAQAAPQRRLRGLPARRLNVWRTSAAYCL